MQWELAEIASPFSGWIEELVRFVAIVTKLPGKRCDRHDNFLPNEHMQESQTSLIINPKSSHSTGVAVEDD